MGGPEIERLISLLSRLPGLGPRSAQRIALKLLANPESRMIPLAAALAAAAREIKPCRLCGNLDSADPCLICTDPTRDPTRICVLETVGDLWAIERSRAYRGHYHVLGGTLSALNGTMPEDLNLETLLCRVRAGKIEEVILALAATVDGAATTHWLADKLKPTGVSLTLLAQGVPMGGSLEILDEGTLGNALRSRRPANSQA